jgi:hypothetical protein
MDKHRYGDRRGENGIESPSEFCCEQRVGIAWE